MLVEASHAGVPVVCGEHAAAPELVPPASLCRVDYRRNTPFTAHFDHNLGHLRLDDMIRAATDPHLGPSRCHAEYRTHAAKLQAALAERPPANEPPLLTASQRAFIDALRVELPQLLDRGAATAQIEAMLPRLLALQDKGSARREACLKELLALSRHPERTLRYIERSAATRCDFTNVGGIDIELCHVAGFYPRFWLEEPVPTGDQTLNRKLSTSPSLTT